MEAESTGLTQNPQGDEAVQEMLEEIRRIRSELEAVNEHRVVKSYNSWYRFIFFHFVKGISVGLGTVVGATVVVSILLFLLSQIEFIPVIGEWVTEIIAEIEKGALH